MKTNDIILPKGCERYRRRCNSEVIEYASWLPQANYAEAWTIYNSFLGLRDGRGLAPAEHALLGLVDRYYLLVFLLGRVDFLKHGEEEVATFGDPAYAPAGNPWLYDRCREVERDPDWHLDLWSRDHYKSSVISYGGVIQEVLRDPEITIAIFSVTRPLAKKHLRSIKQTFEANVHLKATYADVLWDDPRSFAPKWSEDEGLIVKRKGTPKEATIEAWGLIDAMPVGAHYDLMDFDDIITERHARKPEMVQKATEALELADNLARRGGRRWFVGTRYSFGDSYAVLLERRIVTPRVHPATEDGTTTGRPVFLSTAELDKKKRIQHATFAAQMLQNPAAGQGTMFRPDWLNSFEVRPETLHVYILCDPSLGRSTRSDRTAMPVIGIDSRENKYLIDGYCHRMNLAERWLALKALFRKWVNREGVQVVEIGYERYGMQTDLEHFEQMGRLENVFLPVREVSWPLTGDGTKEDRVQRLVPDFRDSRFYIPLFAHDNTLGLTRWRVENGQLYWDSSKNGTWNDDTRLRRDARRRQRDDLVIGPIKCRDEEGKVYDLTQRFIEEYLYFPFGARKDLVDAVSRLYDMEPSAPIIVRPEDINPGVYIDT